MKDFAIYVRLSQQGEDDESARRQVAHGTAWAEKHGYAPVIYQESPGQHSGRSEKRRPKWRELKADLTADKLAGVWVADLARASRSVRDFLSFLDLVQKKGAIFVSEKETVDTSTAAGRAFITILATFNEFYSADISERQKRAIAHVKAKGGTVGRFPLGLVRDPSTRRFIADQSGYQNGHGLTLWIEVVSAFFALYSDSRQVGVDTCIDELAAQGFLWRTTGGLPRPIQRNDLYHLLRNVDAYRSILPNELLDATFRRYSLRRFHHENCARIKYGKTLLWHLCVCAKCGGRFSQGQVDMYSHSYPKCELNGSVRFRVLDDQVWAELEQCVKFSKEQKQQLMRRTPHKTIDHAAQKAQLEQKRERLKELYVDGRFDKAEYERRDADLASKVSMLSDELPLSPIAVERTTEEIDNIVQNWRKGAEVKPEIANALLREMIDKIVVRRKTVEKIVWRKPFSELFSP